MISTKIVRTHHCGELRKENLSETVTLCGWVAKRRDHGGLVFIDLRDRYGITQLVFDPAITGGAQAHSLSGNLRNEFVLWCKGKIRSRPAGMTNLKLTTGEIEVECVDLEILAEAKTPPFLIDDEAEVAETLRLKYRYLDLRRPSLQKNLMIRHRMLSIVRNHLDTHGFCEIETPILYKSTPEGARDFIVPSRLSPGAFYALPQSPQTLKQLLMISGMDRYYQVARCFRDEDLRADRQPEFSQIDIEASFINEEVLFPILEEMTFKLWKEVLNQDIPRPFLRMKYKEAMDRFGSDKPDIRFGLELQDMATVFKNSSFQVFALALNAQKGAVKGIVVQGQAEKFSRKDIEDLQGQIATYGAKGLLWMKILPSGEIQSPASKFLTDIEKSNLVSQFALEPNDLVLIVADPSSKIVFDSLGSLRLILGDKLGVKPKMGEGNPAFLWVTHFPLMEYDEKEKRYFALHHPFTSPRPEWMDDFRAGKNLDKIEASAYDMVLNGVEVGGGSLRIFESEVQAAMFRHLGMSPEEAKTKFGFFLEALQYGTPPHGGVAFGVDRLAALLSGVGPIRDVMAFPKTQRGHCLMSESPSEVTVDQLTELGISVIKR